MDAKPRKYPFNIPMAATILDDGHKQKEHQNHVVKTNLLYSLEDSTPHLWWTMIRLQRMRIYKLTSRRKLGDTWETYWKTNKNKR